MAHRQAFSPHPDADPASEHRRERLGAKLNRAMFQPGRIAIVGASDAPPAAHLQRTLDSWGFNGEVLPINPNRDQVLGRRAIPSLSSVGQPIDLAIVMVRPSAVAGVVEEAAASGVSAMVVYTAGFAELGPAGRELQDRIAAIATDAGMRLLGPNCIGFVNPRDRVAALVAPPQSVPGDLRPGAAAIIAQSGGLMISAMEYAAQVGVGLGLLVATGNEADVSALDALEMALEEPDLRCVGLILEGVGDGRRFADLARRAGELGKTIVALKLGRSLKGAASVATHTAALAGPARVFDGVCAEHGVTTVTTVAELVDHLALLSKRRGNPRSDGIGLITISGGTKILLADLAERDGLRLARISSETTSRLGSTIPDIGIGDNPLDVTAAAIEDEGILREAVRILASDADVGTIALVMHLRKNGGSEAHQRLVKTFVGMQPDLDAQLAVISSIPEGLSGYWRNEVASGAVPFLNDLSALRALRALRVEVEAERPPALPDGVANVARDAVADGRTVIGELDCYRLLDRVEVRTPTSRVARSRAEAVSAADEIGYPVALKINAPAVLHKTDLGGVRLGLGSPSAVASAWDGIFADVSSRDPNLDMDGVLVQEQVPPGPELLVGVRRDPQFGPVVTVALGGVFAEALDDSVTRLAPVGERAALAMLKELRGHRVLEGWRGAESAPLTTAATAISRISALAAALGPTVSSLEVNPMILTAAGPVAVDGLIVLDGSTVGVQSP